MVQVPPDVVAEPDLAPVGLPGAEDVEAVVVEQGDPAGAVVAVGSAQGRQEDAAGPAVDGVRPRVAGLGGQLVSGDLPDDGGVAGVGPGVQHIGPGGPDARDDQVAALQRLAVAAVTGVAQGAGAGAVFFPIELPAFAEFVPDREGMRASGCR